MAVDDEYIEYYMNLKYKIERTKERLIRLRAIFYNQTMSSYITSDGMTVHTQGFSIEENVCSFVDREAAMKKSLEMLEFQYKYFQQFFRKLPYNSRIALKEKYRYKRLITMQITEKKCMDEINEIEEACIHCFGFSVFEDWLDDTDPEEDHQEIINNEFHEMLDVLWM